MRGDLVILDAAKIEAERKERLLSKTGFYNAVGVFACTGAKLLRGESVSLLIARRVSRWMGVDLKALLERWADGERDIDDDTKDLALVGESTRRHAQHREATDRNTQHGDAGRADALAGVTD